MAEASSIGAAFNSYTGDPNLGGGSYGFAKIDTGPLEDYAKYVLLRNKAEWDQRQKDAEKAADELASFAELDLSTTIPKHATVLQKKYDELYDWARQNPDALQYSINGKPNPKYLEYRKKKGDLMNDIKFAKMNSIIDIKRRQAIADEPNEGKKKILQQQLDAEIERKDIRTILDHDQKYNDELPDWGQNAGRSITIKRKLPNQNDFLDYDIFNVDQARKVGNAYSIGIAGIDNTTTGQLKSAGKEDNTLLKASEIFTNVVKDAAATIDPNLTPQQQEDALKQKVSGLGIMKVVDDYNDYMLKMRTGIAAGEFTDQFGKRLDPAQYGDINWKDGITPDEVSQLAQYTGWKGDKMGIKEVQTNDAIEAARISAEWGRIGVAGEAANKAKTTDLISADAVLREVADVLNQGTDAYLNTGTGVFEVIKKGGVEISRTQIGKGSVKKVKVISDPNLLKEFGTVDKEGTVTNVPNSMYYDEDANKVQLVYFKKDNKDKETKVIDRVVDFSPTQWFGQIVRRKNPNADIGGVNALVEGFFNSEKIGRNLSNLRSSYGTTVQGSGKSTETESSSSSSPINAEDAKLTDAQYYQKYKKFKPK